MRGEFLAFDLETTGLEPASDDIIEIGIARFHQGKLVESFQSLVKPSKAIPIEVTQLTGIDQQDVQDAPRIGELLPALHRFFGDAPVVAHNAGFDRAFMRKHDALAANPVIDTYELAAIVLPSASRYSLGGLTTELEIELERAHRAYDDAAATGHLYWRLWQELCALPSAVLADIIRASQGIDWQLRPVFQAALQEALSAGERPARRPFIAEKRFGPPLEIAKARRQPLASDAVAGTFAAAGPLARQLGRYEARAEQVAMAQEVTRSLNQGEQLMIEAGTGTGKSLAYLIPAALWALQNDQRVTVSTQTINLQEQLLTKDIPLAGAVVGGGLRAAMMKGRGNYLCPRRLNTLRRRQPATADEMRTLAKILVWLQNGGTGDRGEITLRAGEWAVWSRLSAQDESCSASRCASEMEGVCPFYRARQEAESAHIVITNHALLIADARVDNRALPDYHNLIIDEAHHLEAAITSGLTRNIDQREILTRLRDLGDLRGGVLGAFLLAARDGVPAGDIARLEGFIGLIGDAVKLMKALIRRYFAAVHEFSKSQGGDGRYARRLAEAQRSSGDFAQVQTAWKPLARFFLEVTDKMEHFCQALPRYEQHQLTDFAENSSEIRGHWRYLAQLHEELEGFTQAPAANAVYSISAGTSPERAQLHIAPLHVGPMMEEYLSQRLESVVCASATLRTQGTFEHINERLYAESFRGVALGSPFNYRQSTLLYLPDDIPEPGRRGGYQRMLERGIIELAAALNGRVMALFTSYSQLRETSRAVTPRLALGGIAVYDQSFGGSRELLLQSFKRADKAVLMGTRSFWEGVDIPGDDLSALVIARLPFAVPSDPVFAARAETYSNSFQQFAVPDAILRFRQGFGRLIRSRDDRGVVAIFDSRILSKSYGGSFLESLPDCTLRIGALDKLPSLASAWIDGG